MKGSPPTITSLTLSSTGSACISAVGSSRTTCDGADPCRVSPGKDGARPPPAAGLPPSWQPVSPSTSAAATAAPRMAAFT